MTFTEAALEVLRLAGEPLHYKKITELAIERNLLSHVGKTPEVTMSSRLAMMVKKDRGQAPIIKVKPGVFAIRESALQGTSLSPEALAAISEVEGGDEGLGESKALEVGVSISAGAISEESVSIAPAAIKAPNVPLPGSDVFPEEEGDDDPILAGLEQESDGAERSGRRRRRRRRRKGDKPETAAEVSSSPRLDSNNNNNNSSGSGTSAPNTSQRERFRDRDRSRPERSARPERSDRGDDRSDRERERSERERERSERNERERSDRNERFERSERRTEDSHSRSEAVDANLDWNRQPADGDLLGKDLADAVSMVMARGDRTPHTFARVAELLVRRGRLSGSPAALAPTIAASVRADIARSELQRARPRFRLRQLAGGTARISLSDWHLPKGLQRAEQDMLSASDRYASEMRRALIQKLSELPTAGFAELLATWLNAEGVTALRAVRRPGSSGSELHFAGTRKTGSEEVRLAIVVQRGSRDIDREGVVDVRGALHHYGQAQAAWIVTLGRITSGAREEAGAQAAACALFDGNALVAAMERLGVAVRRNVIMHHEIDYDLLESLGDSPEQRERREREQERERRDHNERTRASQQPRGRSGRGPSPAPQARGERQDRDVRDEHDDEEQAPIAARPVKLRDADWDDEAPHGLAAASEEEGVSEAPAPRAFALHDADESAQLRDELDSDSDEHADDEDFSTSEESDSDEDFSARDADADDADDADDDSEDDDSEDGDDSEDDDSEDGDDDDVEASGAEDSEGSDDSDDGDDSDEGDDADNDSDDESGDEHAADGDGDTDEATPGETAERGRRR